MRKLRYAVFLFVPVALGTLAALPAKKPAAACVVANAWVNEHKGELPTTWAEFSNFDRAHRQAIYAALTAPQKLGLWHEQFERYRLRDSLTAEQIAHLSEVEHLIATVLARGNTGVTRGSQTDSLVRRTAAKGRVLFGTAKAREYFPILGQTLEAPAKRATVQDCNCDTWGTSASECDSGAGNRCVPIGQYNCEYHSFGCGDFMFYSCDGFCKAAETD